MTTESKAVRWFRCNKVGCEHNGQVMPEHLIMCNHRDQINFAYVTPLPATEKAKVPAARAMGISDEQYAKYYEAAQEALPAAEPATTGERGNGIETRLRFIEEGANDATVAARFRECLPNIRRELAARDPLPAASPQKPNWPATLRERGHTGPDNCPTWYDGCNCDLTEAEKGGRSAWDSHHDPLPAATPKPEPHNDHGKHCLCPKCTLRRINAASPAAGAESQGWLADLRNEVARLTAERNLYMNRDIEHIDRMVKAETQVNLLTAELAELNDHATRTENLAIGYQREIEKALAERDAARAELAAAREQFG